MRDSFDLLQACTVTGPSCSSGTEDQTDWLGKVSSPTGSPRQHSSATTARQQASPKQQGSAGSPRQQSAACHSPKSANVDSKETKQAVNASSKYLRIY